jgi:hypothetical protein
MVGTTMVSINFISPTAAACALRRDILQKIVFQGSFLWGCYDAARAG